MKKGIIILLSAVLVLASCNSFNKVLTTDNIDFKYEAAKAYYLQGEYMKASQLLEGVITMLKGSDKAEESLILLANCYYNSKDFDTASQYFKVYYTNYPRGEFAE
jgi:outer membrane protein assembly factor BamD